jgi:Synergist-CTERM protein sorting domain-containing protein
MTTIAPATVTTTSVRSTIAGATIRASSGAWRARRGSAALVDAIANPAPGRRARVEAALDAILARIAGCDHTNDYCAAAELDEEASSGCSIAGGSLVLALLVLPFALRRRHALRLVFLIAPVTARADLRWHFDARGGASLDETAASASVGIGADYVHWTGGVQLEWNPWFSIDAGRAVAGSLNVYATLARRWYVRPELSIYSRAELGSSTLLFELVGIDQYTTGHYYGG